MINISVSAKNREIIIYFRFCFDYIRYGFNIVLSNICISIFVFVNDRNVFLLTNLFVFVNEINFDFIHL